MDALLAQRVDDVDTVVANVMRAASEECEPGACLVHSVLEPCAREAVTTLWDSPIKAHVPLLALRRVRACIRAGSCDTTEW